MRKPLLAVAAAAVALLLPAVPASAAHSSHPVDTSPAAQALDVRAIVTNPDGTGSVTIWTPAEGVGAQGLYRQLKAQGVKGLIDPAAAATMSPTLNEPVDCNIQGAYALYRLCGINRYHWGGTHPAVYFLDHTGAQWPVYEAVVKWNESTAIDSGYRFSTSCPSSAHCVDVYDRDYGATGWVGQTNFAFNGLTITYATISLNDHQASGYIPAGDAHWHRETSCHEEGHALGLDHNLFTTSCLYFQHTSSRSQYPGPGDWLMLDSIY